MCLVTGDKHNEKEEKATEDIKVRILKYYVHIAIYINKLKGKTGPGSSWALIWSIYTHPPPPHQLYRHLAMGTTSTVRSSPIQGTTEK